MTTLQVYNEFRVALANIYSASEAENITNWVFENVTGKKKFQIRTYRLTKQDQENENLTPGQLLLLKKYLEELKKHTPVQYVLEEAWFYKRKFFVDNNVLIPRPETEELVEWIIQEVINIEKSTACSILDIGTGSGCIPVTLKIELPGCSISSLDVSNEALKVAGKNASDHKADVQFLEINFLDEQLWNTLSKFDIIVSNPPYIPDQEKAMLDRNVTAFEPSIALFVEDNNPFIFYQKIARFAQKHLSNDGKIFVEVHEKFAGEVKIILKKNGFNASIKKDIYGKERMVRAIR